MITYTLTDATAPHARYSATDYDRLTNNHSSPSSPPQSPDFRPARISHAERTNARPTGPTADARISSPKRTSVPSSRRPSTIRRQASYSSIKEDVGGIAQSFFESPSRHDSTHAQFEKNSEGQVDGKDACSCCCHCGKAREGRFAKLTSRRRSRSYSPPRTNVSELSGWTLELSETAGEVKVGEATLNKAGESRLERLPTEILDRIISQLALDIPPADYAPRNADLIHCLLTSRTIYAATITTLYRHITIPHSSVFSKFLNQVLRQPALGTLVRRLDLSHFTSIGMGRTRQVIQTIQNLTSKTLLECLELTPYVQEVLLQEELDDDVDEVVLRKMFFDLPNLQALDLCAASSTAFVNAFEAALTNLTPRESVMLNIRRLSLHECFTLHSSSLEKLLPQLPRLTHLDLFHTRVTDSALASIPKTATLTHLNLGRCSQITGQGTVSFLTSHPAATGLVYLNLACDTSRYRLLWESDVETLLPALPSTLVSLNLNGAKICSAHIPLLLPLTKHLEELGLASTDILLADINALFVPPPTSSSLITAEGEWTPPTLRYLDLTALPTLSQPSLFSPACVLFNSLSAPLEVIELGDKVISALRQCEKTNKRLGWVVKELGRRGWYVREPTQGSGAGGRRAWKMGAMWWGMRKIPVAWGEVGGLYGHYMFKK